MPVGAWLRGCRWRYGQTPSFALMAGASTDERQGHAGGLPQVRRQKALRGEAGRNSEQLTPGGFGHNICPACGLVGLVEGSNIAGTNAGDGVRPQPWNHALTEASVIFCYQCEQRSGPPAGATGWGGGKDPATAAFRTCWCGWPRSIGTPMRRGSAGRATARSATICHADIYVVEALVTTVTNVNFDPERIGRSSVAATTS